MWPVGILQTPEGSKTARVGNMFSAAYDMNAACKPAGRINKASSSKVVRGNGNLRITETSYRQLPSEERMVGNLGQRKQRRQRS